MKRRLSAVLPGAAPTGTLGGMIDASNRNHSHMRYRNGIGRLVVAGLGLALALMASGSAQAQSFAAFSTPTDDTPSAVGTYSNGCLLGGVAVPLDGPGFQLVRPSRNAYWAHPALLSYLGDIGRRSEAAGLNPLLIADVGLPRGGEIAGHASHEIGLDVDIWLRQTLPRLPPTAREGLSSTLVVDRSRFVVGSAFSDVHAELIRIAASDPRVTRIFVHPAIKIALCDRDWPDRGFLRVLRPWFGHDSHIHVRLACPAGNDQCEPQEPVPPGDGCDAELYSWIPDPANPPPPMPPRPPPPPLHPVCAALLAAP